MASGEFLDIDDDYDEILSLVPESIVHENRRITGKNVFGGTGSSSLGSEFKNPNDFVINVATKKREINTTALFFLTQSKNVDGLTDSRKFPGPAGVLPTGSVIAAETSDALKPPLIEKVTRTENSSTQSTLNKLISERQEYISKDPWKFLLRCLNILNDAFGDKSQRIPTIEWLRRNAPRLPDETHLPLLVAVVYGNPMPESLRTIRQTTPSVTLVDPSGIILAALTPSFIEEFADKVSNGTAIALKNVSLLRIRQTVILKISKKNVLAFANTHDPSREPAVPSCSVQSGETFPRKISEDNVYCWQHFPLHLDDVMSNFEHLRDMLNR